MMSIAPDGGEKTNDKRPLCRDIKDFESFLLLIDNAYSEFCQSYSSNGNPSRTPPSTHAPKPHNHLCLGGSANLGERLLDLVASLEDVLVM